MVIWTDSWMALPAKTQIIRSFHISLIWEQASKSLSQPFQENMMCLNFTSSEDHTFPLPHRTFTHTACVFTKVLCVLHHSKAMGETAIYHEAWQEGTLWHRRGVHQELIPMFDSKAKCSKTSCIIVTISWTGCLFFIYYISTASKWILCKVFWLVLGLLYVCVVLKLNSQIWKFICFHSNKNINDLFSGTYTKRQLKTHLFCFKT